MDRTRELAARRNPHVGGVPIEKSRGGFAITTVLHSTEGRVPGIKEESFHGIAEEAKNFCPVSKTLAGVNIELEAKIAGGG